MAVSKLKRKIEKYNVILRYYECATKKLTSKTSHDQEVIFIYLFILYY